MKTQSSDSIFKSIADDNGLYGKRWLILLEGFLLMLMVNAITLFEDTACSLLLNILRRKMKRQ